MLVTLNFKDVKPFLLELKHREITDVFYQESGSSYQHGGSVQFSGLTKSRDTLVNYSVPLPEGVKTSYGYGQNWTMDNTGSWVRTLPDRKELRHILKTLKVNGDLIESFMKKSTPKLKSVAIEEISSTVEDQEVTEKEVTISESKSLFTFERENASKPVELQVLLTSGFHGEKDLKYRLSVPAEDTKLLTEIKSHLADNDVRLIRGSIEVSK